MSFSLAWIDVAAVVLVREKEGERVQRIRERWGMAAGESQRRGTSACRTRLHLCSSDDRRSTGSSGYGEVAPVER